MDDDQTPNPRGTPQMKNDQPYDGQDDSPFHWGGQPRHPSSKTPQIHRTLGCCEVCGEDHTALVAYGSRLCRVEESIGGWMELNNRIVPALTDMRKLQIEVQKHHSLGFWGRLGWLLWGPEPIGVYGRYR